MAELEAVIEEQLIEQLCHGVSQWTYRPDIRTEEQLWDNFKYILTQNNKEKLGDTPLSDSEFAKIKNDVSHASFYNAGKWMTGENGKVFVHMQRGNEQLHLLVMNNEHIAGGSSVYEVINQFQAFQQEDVEEDKRDRRFDVTLLINGIPLIHMELKNKNHAYMDGFRQIKTYISEGKFRGLFSNVQMFVVSNGVDTKYFSAARDTELNKKFMTGWLDAENQPVCSLENFANDVLHIPLAHEMVTQYTVLDTDKKKLLILRPYQIHAIKAMREASKKGVSGYIWHTTGSGKTMTSYKASRNLLMDIPSIEKTVFLIDRKDLDMQTKMAFQSYAGSDTIDVDDTEHVGALIQKLADGNRQMIVTTRQKMQIMVERRLKAGSKHYEKIRNLKVAFVVDECHRSVSPKAKGKIAAFFAHSLWYGFTGTPIFEANKYEQKGDFAQTTEQLYGKCLHSYTIKEAIHDEAVLGFMVENLGPQGKNIDPKVFERPSHMREVLRVILNQSKTKFGMENSKGKTYEAILTVKSIARAQKYYDLLKKVKAGEDELQIDEEITRSIPDFPRFAITYSVSENDESSQVNQEKMQDYLGDYNAMFGTNYKIAGIQAYNGNLNDRLARKEKKYMQRAEQLDLVIVVDRLLTGFDAPCLSTLFMDRPPMSSQDIIQAFSRTNRLFDGKKQFGQVVTFQYPQEFKEAIDDALMLYSRGGDGSPLAEDWDKVKKSFGVSVKAIHGLGKSAEDIKVLSKQQKKAFLKLFRALDHDFAHLKAFSKYEDSMLKDYDFSEEEYETYAAIYKNISEELRSEPSDKDEDDDVPMEDYDLIAYYKLRVDFEYIVDLLQDIVESFEQSANIQEEDFANKIQTLRELIDEFSTDNPKLGQLLTIVLNDIEDHRSKYAGQDISVIISQMRSGVIDKELEAFANKWFLHVEDVKYEAYRFKDGEIVNENNLKEKADYAAYKENTESALKKFKFFPAMIQDFKGNLMPEISPLIIK